MSVRAAAVQRLDRGWRICFRGGFSRGQKVGGGHGGRGGGGGDWQAASGLLHMGPSTRLLEPPHNVAADFPPREPAKRASAQVSMTCCHSPSLRSKSLSLADPQVRGGVWN